MKSSGSAPPAPGFIPKLWKETLIHQDVVTYAEGLLSKVKDLIRAGISTLASTYVHIQDFEPNQNALAELQGTAEAYAFEHFLEP